MFNECTLLMDYSLFMLLLIPNASYNPLYFSNDLIYVSEIPNDINPLDFLRNAKNY